MQQSLNDLKNEFIVRQLKKETVKDNTGTEFAYNCKIGNVYFCPDNVIIDNGNAIFDYHINRERYIIMDNYILDLYEKKFIKYKPQYSTIYEEVRDSFYDTLQDIEHISIRENKDKSRVITFKLPYGEAEIKIDSQNRIIRYKNERLTEIGNNFMFYNNSLLQISIPNVEVIGDNFLYSNNSLGSIYLNSVERIGDNFLCNNIILERFIGYNVKYIGECFLFSNEKLSELNLYMAKNIGPRCMASNEYLIYVDISGCDGLGEYSFNSATSIRTLYTNSRIQMGDGCFAQDKKHDFAYYKIRR